MINIDRDLFCVLLVLMMVLGSCSYQVGEVIGDNIFGPTCRLK